MNSAEQNARIINTALSHYDASNKLEFVAKTLGLPFASLAVATQAYAILRGIDTGHNGTNIIAGALTFVMGMLYIAVTKNWEWKRIEQLTGQNRTAVRNIFDSIHWRLSRKTSDKVSALLEGNDQ